MARRLTKQEQERIDILEANLAEDAGHMGWTRDDYPGCPKRRAERERQLELQLDDANADIVEEYEEVYG